MEDGFDLCECISSHEMAIQRLLNALRGSQSYCTDTECLNELPGTRINGNGTTAELSTTFLMVFGILALTIIMYLFRPSSIRNAKAAPARPDDDHDGFHENHQPPPAPPIA